MGKSLALRAFERTAPQIPFRRSGVSTNIAGLRARRGIYQLPPKPEYAYREGYVLAFDIERKEWRHLNTYVPHLRS